MHEAKPAQQTGSGTRELPNTHEMVVIHRIFRRELPLVADIIQRTPHRDARQAAPVARHIGLVLSGLHHHHEAEDTYLWPMLTDRARLHADLIRKMEAQHQAAAGHSRRVEQLARQWQRSPSPSATAELAAALMRLSHVLTEHLNDEEAEILPLVREHITVAEWEELGRASFAKFPRSARPIMMGLLMEEATPSERVLFLSKAPPPVRLSWRVIGQSSYRRYIRRVRG